MVLEDYTCCIVCICSQERVTNHSCLAAMAMLPRGPSHHGGSVQHVRTCIRLHTKHAIGVIVGPPSSHESGMERRQQHQLLRKRKKSSRRHGLTSLLCSPPWLPGARHWLLRCLRQERRLQQQQLPRQVGRQGEVGLARPQAPLPDGALENVHLIV